MNIVDYSSSDEETGTVRTGDLELPSFLSSYCGDSLRFSPHIDEPSLHQNRQRSFPHEIGQWATHIYIDCWYVWSCTNHHLGSGGFHNLVNALIESPLLKDDTLWKAFAMTEQTHLSLSKTWPIRYHWIPGLVQSLRQSLSKFNQFDVCFDKVDLLVNEERSRSFVVLCANDSSSDHLNSMVTMINQSVTAFRGPQFYENPTFHVSLSWCIGDYRKFDLIDVNHLKVSVSRALEEMLRTFSVSVEKVVCKSGDKYFDVFLDQ